MKKEVNVGDYSFHFEKAVPYLLSLLVIAVAVIFQFTEQSFNKSIDFNSLFAKWVVTSVQLVAMRIIWVPAGKDKIRLDATSPFYKNARAYANVVKGVTDHKLNEKFKDYCQLESDRLRDEKKKGILQNAGLELEQYEKYKTASIKIMRGAHLTLAQIMAIKKVYRGIKVKPINPITLATDAPVKHHYSLGLEYNEKLEEGGRTAYKVISKLISALCFSLLMLDLADDITSVAAWAMFVSQVAMMCVAAWGGYNDGIEQLAVRKNGVYKRRILFYKSFFEATGVVFDVKIAEDPEEKHK